MKVCLRKVKEKEKEYINVFMMEIKDFGIRDNGNQIVSTDKEFYNTVMEKFIKEVLSVTKRKDMDF